MDADKLKKFHQLTESFINEVEKRNLNEGATDVAKAKWAGLKGGIQGFGKQIKGGFNKAVGNIANKGISAVSKGLGGDPNKSPWAKSAQNLATKGQQQIDTGKNQAYTDKYNAYVSSAVDSLVSDLKSLNINVTNKNKLVADVKNSIINSTKNPAGAAKKQPAPKPVANKPAAASMPATSTPAPSKVSSTQKQPAAKPVAQQQTPSGKPMLGSKGYPALGTPPAGMRLAANQRQFVPIEQGEKQTQATTNEPEKQPLQRDADKQKKKQQAKKYVAAQSAKKAAE